MKPRAEWGPADEFVDGTSKLLAFVVAGALLFAFGAGAANEIVGTLHMVEHWKGANNRGYIKCSDGQLELGNFDFSGEIKAPLDIDALAKMCGDTGRAIISNVGPLP